MSDLQFSPASGVFVSLMKAFAEFAQLPGEVGDDSIGISFEIEAHSVSVLPHPELAEQLVVEVDVCSIGTSREAGEPLALVHRLNYAARFEHGWIAAIGPDDRLVLFTTRAIANTSPGELEALIVLGLEKAEAIDALCKEAALSGDAQAAASSLSSAVSLQTIRG
jgi:hypothetical protein